MVESIIYSFVHGKKNYTLFTRNDVNPYNTTITCYDSELDIIQSSVISSELFAHQSLKVVDENIETWFNSSEKVPNLNLIK